MTSTLKNRLVGTVILVALIVIFLPDFLDGKKEESELLFDSIPAIPDKKPIIRPEPFPSARVEQQAHRPIEIVNDSADDDKMKLAVKTNVKPKQVEKKKESAEKSQATKEHIQTGSGWVVQLGSFSHQKNVRLLLDKLESAGYRTFSRPIQTQSGVLTKVFVGPDVQKTKLEAAIPHLKELTGLNGKVTRFTVQP